MSAQHPRPAHQVRVEYSSLHEALVDAQRVSADLRTTVDGQLLVPAAEVDFLARRLQQFVRLCLDNLPAGSTEGTAS